MWWPNLSLVVTSIYTGLAQGVQPLISQAYGRKQTDTVRKQLKYSLLSMAVFSAAVYLILFFFASPVAAVFNSEKNPELQRIAVEGLKLYFTSVLFTGFNIVLSTYFTSVEKALPAQVISLLRGLILIIPAAFSHGFSLAHDRRMAGAARHRASYRRGGPAFSAAVQKSVQFRPLTNSFFCRYSEKERSYAMKKADRTGHRQRGCDPLL